MKRLRQWVARGAAAISLALLVLAIAMWVRSHSREDVVMYWGNSCGSAIHTLNGRVAIVNENLMSSRRHWEYDSNALQTGFDPAEPFHRHSIWNRLGFYLSRSARPRGTVPGDASLPQGQNFPAVVRYFDLVMPFWLICLLLTLFPLWIFAIPALRRARRPHGFCPKCGYDLRATPDRCPECGKVVDERESLSN